GREPVPDLRRREPAGLDHGVRHPHRTPSRERVTIGGGMRGLTALVLAASLVASTAAADIASVFGGAIPCTVQPDGVRYCGGANPTVPTWAAVTPIDVTVALPPAPASGPDGNYPVIGIYHGWGGTKTPFVSFPPYPSLGAYAQRGYAAFSMTFRGWGMSCGA